MRWNGKWTDEKDAALILLFEEGATIERIAADIHRNPGSIVSRLRVLGFEMEAIAERDTEITCTPTLYRSADERFQTAMRKAKNAGLENPPAMTVIKDDRPISYEMRRYERVADASGFGSPSLQCADWA